MAISNIGQSIYSSALQSKQQNINNLFSAVQAGDLASAQKAYAASGLPPMHANNTSPMGRLYQALRNNDLAGARQAAQDMQGKNGKSIASATSTSTAQKTTATVATTAQASSQSSTSNLFAMLGLGNNVNTWG